MAAKQFQPRKDITGRRFGRLLVIECVGPIGICQHLHWRCRCGCGNEKIASLQNLQRGNVCSCGCLQREHRQARGQLWKIARTTHGMTGSPTYMAWYGMLQRVKSRDSHKYKYYGSRGITVCDRWSKFENFLADMGTRPSAELSLDRINNDGDYEPGNCRWATRSQQRNNRRNICKGKDRP